MDNGTLKRLAGPGYLANAATNIYVPPSSSIYGVINQIHIANTTGSTATFSLYIGATGGSAGGTELEKSYAIPANKDWERSFFPGIRVTSSDFLSGSASANSALVITVMGTESVV